MGEERGGERERSRYRCNMEIINDYIWRTTENDHEFMNSSSNGINTLLSDCANHRQTERSLC